MYLGTYLIGQDISNAAHSMLVLVVGPYSRRYLFQTKSSTWLGDLSKIHRYLKNRAGVARSCRHQERIVQRELFYAALEDKHMSMYAHKTRFIVDSTA